MHGFTYATERDRHEERVARGLRAYAVRGTEGRSRRRLRADPCPLVALAQWFGARRRPTVPVAS